MESQYCLKHSVWDSANIALFLLCWITLNHWSFHRQIDIAAQWVSTCSLWNPFNWILCCASYSNMLLYASSFDLSFLLTPWNIHKTVLLSNWMLHNSVTPHFCTKPMLIQVSQLHWESQAVIKVKTTCCFLRPETSTFHLLLKQANQCIIKHLNTILHSKSNCLPWTNQQYQAAEAKIKAHLAPKAFSEP